MRKIDGDTAEKLLRERGMYDAANLIANMPTIHYRRFSRKGQEIDNFLASKEDVLEIDTTAYKRPLSCYQSYREYLTRWNITTCYCYMEQGRVFLERIPGRADNAAYNAIRRP